MADKHRVNGPTVLAYGKKAQEQFNAIRGDLAALVNEVATVPYDSPTASQFKRECAELAAAYSGNLLQDLAAIADAIRTATSNLAASLGGTAINISVDGTAVPIPAIPKSDGSVVDVDLEALEALSPAVTARFGSITAALDQHLAALIATDWEGPGKRNAVDQVQPFTTATKARSEEARQSIVEFIKDQVEMTRRMDK